MRWKTHSLRITKCHLLPGTERDIKLVRGGPCMSLAKSEGHGACMGVAVTQMVDEPS